MKILHLDNYTSVVIEHIYYVKMCGSIITVYLANGQQVSTHCKSDDHARECYEMIKTILEAA
jgi:hypothetical protein